MEGTHLLINWQYACWHTCIVYTWLIGAMHFLAKQEETAIPAELLKKDSIRNETIECRDNVTTFIANIWL